ncbi:hypothetical protein V5799_009021 [Amblyomma americanum]|uniref:Uncharacterized protein n=1 Tax=Amblyomma americanum TaxID=6943 RepID=A0AAQ4FD70_AMBAM
MLMKMMRNITLSAQGRPREALTAAERVSLAYDLCTDAYRNRADYSSVMNELIFDKLTLFSHSLAYTTNLNTAVADALATLAVKWNVPLFFQIDLASRPKNEKKITLVVDYSVTLLRWMSHKRALLTPEATARLINLYYELRSVSHGTSDDRALALLQLDEKITVQWVSVLLSLKGLRSRLRYYSLDHLRHRVGSGQECLEAINRALAPNSTLRADNAVLTDEHLFAAVDDAVNSQWATRSLVRDFVALHVVRQLAPLTSPRFVDALLDNPSRGTSYVASECVSAVSRLVPGGSLTNLVFQDPVATERRERALNHLERIWNQTATHLLAANEKRGGRREERQEEEEGSTFQPVGCLAERTGRYAGC